MRRTEKRKNYLIVLLAALLVLSIPLSISHIFKSSAYITGAEISRITGEYGYITDREGNIISDNGNISHVSVFGSLISNGNNKNGIYPQYKDQLAPYGFDPIAGIDSIKDLKGGTLKTTLIPLEDQKLIVDAFGGRRGCCFSYNYETGEIYTAISLPSDIWDNGKNDFSLQNRAFDGLYTPGSTMKIVTALCAIAQNKELLNTVYECDGTYTLPDGNTVTCPLIHGSMNFTSAIGNSCNGYFAKLIGQLDVNETIAYLETLGFSVNGKAEKESVDKLTKTSSSTGFVTNTTFSDVWSLIGQGTSSINVMDMAMIAGAVANGGKAAYPHIISEITDNNKEKAIYTAPELEMLTLASEDDAQILRNKWQSAYEKYYKVYGDVTFAKTGTAQENNGASENRLLLGVCEESKAAFFIVIEDYRSGKVPLEIAKILSAVLPRAEN